MKSINDIVRIHFFCSFKCTATKCACLVRYGPGINLFTNHSAVYVPASALHCCIEQQWIEKYRNDLKVKRSILKISDLTH